MTERISKKERKIPEGLTSEQIKIWQDINSMLESDKLSPTNLSVETTNEIQLEKMAFEEELRKKKINKKNIESAEYLLWHRLIGSSNVVPKFDFNEDEIDVDEDDKKNTKMEKSDKKVGVIENFIRELYNEYKNK